MALQTNRPTDRLKIEHRRELAHLPFEEKFRMIVEMNRLAAQARGSVKRA